MTDTPAPLDPDQVECPTCTANVGEVCLAPSGRKSRTVHMARRRAAVAGQVHRRRREQPRDRRGSSPATPEGSSKGGKVTAQNRRRRKAEIAAAAEAEKERLEHEAMQAKAEQLASDAVKYAEDRQLVRRQALDNAYKAGERLGEALTHLKRPKGYDEDGKPITEPVEKFHIVKGKRAPLFDIDGERVIDERPEIVGHWSVAEVESLAKSASVALNALRLEEGKPTGILEQQGDGTRPADVLGEAGVDDLIEFAQRHLPREGGETT